MFIHIKHAKTDILQFHSMPTIPKTTIAITPISIAQQVQGKQVVPWDFPFIVGDNLVGALRFLAPLLSTVDGTGGEAT